MAAKSAEPLLQRRQQEEEKVYYDNCPGCRQDERSEAYSGIPYKEFIYIWIVTLCSSLPKSSLYPFSYFMVRDMNIAKREEDIGFYVGFLASANMFGRVLTSLFWGIVADRYGRKPVIVISIISVIIFNTLFGLSTTFWMAITMRLLLGSFNGLLGPIKAYASEVCRKEHQALGLSLVSTARGIGLIIGPAIGGFFAQPAEKYPDIFSKESFLGRFPYFLPCLLISTFAFFVLIACFWLPETLHKHSNNKTEYETIEVPEASLHGSDLKENKGTVRSFGSNWNLLRNWPLMSSMIVYCVFSLHDTAYSEDLKSRRILGHGVESGGLYYFDSTQPFESSRQPLQVTITPLQWHYRMGHPSLSSLKSLIPSLFSISNLDCEICQMSKHICATFYVSSNLKESCPFSLVHSDIWGPIKASSLNGNKYFILFIDDFTHMTWLNLFKDRT